jgi:hypothetical protein
VLEAPLLHVRNTDHGQCERVNRKFKRVHSHGQPQQMWIPMIARAGSGSTKVGARTVAVGKFRHAE